MCVHRLASCICTLSKLSKIHTQNAHRRLPRCKSQLIDVTVDKSSKLNVNTTLTIHMHCCSNTTKSSIYYNYIEVNGHESIASFIYKLLAVITRMIPFNQTLQQCINTSNSAQFITQFITFGHFSPIWQKQSGHPSAKVPKHTCAVQQYQKLVLRLHYAVLHRADHPTGLFIFTTT